MQISVSNLNEYSCKNGLFEVDRFLQTLSEKGC